MYLPRFARLGLLVLLLFPLIPATRAQDPDLTKRLEQALQALPTRNRPADVRALRSVATFLTANAPAALATAEGELATAGQQAPLQLTPQQRADLMRVYSYHAERVAAAVNSRPFTAADAQKIQNGITALGAFIDNLEDLGRLDPRSANYRNGIARIIASVPNRPAGAGRQP